MTRGRLPPPTNEEAGPPNWTVDRTVFEMWLRYQARLSPHPYDYGTAACAALSPKPKGRTRQPRWCSRSSGPYSAPTSLRPPQPALELGPSDSRAHSPGASSMRYSSPAIPRWHLDGWESG